jgi:hypothetical protein
VRAGVRAGDCESEASTGIVAAREAFEEAGQKLLGNAGAFVLDRDPDVTVALLGVRASNGASRSGDCG